MGQALGRLQPDEEAEKRLFFRIVTTASSNARLGIFKMECWHRFNQTLTLASKHLGRGKAFTVIASDSVLHNVLQQHKLLMAEPSPQSKQEMIDKTDSHLRIATSSCRHASHQPQPMSWWLTDSEAVQSTGFAIHHHKLYQEEEGPAPCGKGLLYVQKTR